MIFLKIFPKIKNGSKISDEKHIVRYCKPSNFDDNKKEVLPPAFELKEGEDYLSCTCPECCKDNSYEQACKDISLIYRTKKTGLFLLLNIAKIKNAGRENNHNDMYIEKKANNKISSYCGIHNSSNSFKLCRALALEATEELKKK